MRDVIPSLIRPAEALRDYMYLNRMSATQFAKKLQCNGTYLRSITRAEFRPSKRLAKDITQATNGEVVFPDDLWPKKSK